MMPNSAKNTETTSELIRKNFKASVGSPSLYVGTLILIILVSYSGGFHTDKMGPVLNRVQFFITFAIVLFASFHVFSAIVSVLARKVVLGDIGLELLTSVPVATVGSLVTEPLVVHFSVQGKMVSSTAEIFVNTFIFVPILILVFSYHIRVISSLFSHGSSNRAVNLNATQDNAGDDTAPVATGTARPANAPVYLESDDHTVKIVYANRLVLKRTKLSREMQQWHGCGFQVHKSFWVNAHHVERRERNGRQMYLVLKSGHRIPVGRSYEKEISRVIGD